MTLIEMLDLARTEASLTKAANGTHIFYSYHFESKMIKYYHYLELIKSGLHPTYRKHLGCKFELKDNFWLLSLFTSKSSTLFYEDIMINNIALHGNMHKFVNQSIVMQNSAFSEYFTTTNNLALGPKYLKNMNTDNIVKESIEAYRISVLNANFNNPIILIESLYENLSNIQPNSTTIIQKSKINTHLQLTRKMEYLNMFGIRNSDIYNFAVNFEQNKNIYGEPYAKNEFYINYNESPHFRIFPKKKSN